MQASSSAWVGSSGFSFRPQGLRVNSVELERGKGGKFWELYKGNRRPIRVRFLYERAWLSNHFRNAEKARIAKFIGYLASQGTYGGGILFEVMK